MRITRARAIAFALPAATAMLLAACSSSPSDAGTNGDDGASDGLTELSIQLSFVPTAQNLGDILALENGYFEEAGFDPVNLVPGPTAVEASVATGNVHVGQSTAFTTANAIVNSEMDLRIIATGLQTNPFTILSLEENPISTPADLEGKRIGVAAGTAETLVRGLAAANDVDADTITFVPAEGNPALLTNGEVDGYFGLETNELIVLQRDWDNIVSLPLAENGVPFSSQSMIVTPEMIEENRDLLKRYLVAEIRGWIDAHEDLEGAVDLLVTDHGSNLGLTHEVAFPQGEVVLRLMEPAHDEGIFYLDAAGIEANIDAIAQTGIDIDADTLFDMSLLEEVYAENPELLEAQR